MPRIVPQSVPASYCPMLALPAPKIAGLLPAHVPSSMPPSTRYVFASPALDDLSNQQQNRLFDATEMLLDIAVEFMRGTFNEDALRAAETVFHRAVGGHSVARPLSPKQFNAELDADWFEMLARAKQAQPLSTAEADAFMRRARAFRKDGAV